jgi:cytochrome c
MKLIVTLSVLALLSGCGKAPDAMGTEEANAASTTKLAAAGTAPASFAQCGVCHKVEAGVPNGLGPNLHGIFGKKSGLSAGYSYSPAMKAAGLTWNAATLDKFLTKPQTLVPGTRMSYPGQADPAKRAEIIAWLKKNS